MDSTVTRSDGSVDRNASTRRDGKPSGDEVKRKSIPLPPKARRPTVKDLPGSRIRLELYEMRKAQAQLAARQRLLQDKILAERQRATELATMENKRVKAKLDQAERTLIALKNQKAAPSASSQTSAKIQALSIDSFDDDLSEIDLASGEAHGCTGITQEDSRDLENEYLDTREEIKEEGGKEEKEEYEYMSWFINYSENGDRYFYCEETEESTWDDPRSLEAQKAKQVPPFSYWHDLWRGPPTHQHLTPQPVTARQTSYDMGMNQDHSVACSARNAFDTYHIWEEHQSPEFWTPMSAREARLQTSLAKMQRIVAEAKENERRALSRAEATALTQANLVERVRQEERQQLILASTRASSRRHRAYRHYH